MARRPRYKFNNQPKVIDIGMRLADVKRMNLQSEPHEYKQNKDPRHKFLLNQTTTPKVTELNFLVRGRVSSEDNPAKRCGNASESN